MEIKEIKEIIKDKKEIILNNLKECPKSCCIYILYNMVDDKFYIGSTYDLKMRLYAGLRKSKTSYKFINDDNIKNFKCYLYKEFDIADKDYEVNLRTEENQLINSFRNNDKLYNTIKRIEELPKRFLRDDVKQSFLSKINIAGDDECWEWRGRINNKGYGHIKWEEDGRKKQITVHKIAYYYFKDEWVNNLFIMHTCNNKKCCNPNHLKIGGHRENTQQAAKDGLMKKLIEPQILEKIKELNLAGKTLKEIKKELKLNIGRYALLKILDKKVYSYLDFLKDYEYKDNEIKQLSLAEKETIIIDFLAENYKKYSLIQLKELIKEKYKISIMRKDIRYILEKNNLIKEKRHEIVWTDDLNDLIIKKSKDIYFGAKDIKNELQKLNPNIDYKDSDILKQIKILKIDRKPNTTRLNIKHKEFLIEKYKTISNDADVLKEFEKEFGRISLNFIKNYRIKNNISKKDIEYKWTKDLNEYLVNNYSNTNTKKLMLDINKNFKTNFTLKAITKRAEKLKLKKELREIERKKQYGEVCEHLKNSNLSGKTIYKVYSELNISNKYKFRIKDLEQIAKDNNLVEFKEIKYGNYIINQYVFL